MKIKLPILIYLSLVFFAFSSGAEDGVNASDETNVEAEKTAAFSPLRSGIWRSGGNNPFWIRVVDQDVYWLGMNLPREDFELGQEWSNVGHGKITGNELVIKWVDIPNGKDASEGSVTMTILSETEIKVAGELGDFGNKSWKWIQDQQNIFSLPEIRNRTHKSN